MPIAYTCAELLGKPLSERVFDRAGMRARYGEKGDRPAARTGGNGIYCLNHTGEKCTLSDEYGGLTDAQQQLYDRLDGVGEGEDILILPDNATRGFDTLARDDMARGRAHRR